MADVIKTTFQVKRGTAARWEELNLILNPGEPGFEIDTFKLKIGNGSTPWKELPYVNDVDISSSKTYMLNNKKQWIQVQVNTGSGGGGGTSGEIIYEGGEI